MSAERMQAPYLPSGGTRVPLPCGHHNARLRPGERTAERRCRTCRNYYLIECSDTETALVSDITCPACGASMNSEGDMWWCPGCGDEWDDETVRGVVR
jgi:hypothetical protein